MNMFSAIARSYVDDHMEPASARFLILFQGLFNGQRICIVEPRFISRPVRYIENLVITNLLENNQSVRYISVQLIINRTDGKDRAD